MTATAATRTRRPLTRYARTRLPEALHVRLTEDAARRGLTHSKLIRALLEAHYKIRPMPRETVNGASYAVARELNRIGVNLNQIAHLANATRLVPVVELKRLLERLAATLDRL